MISRDRLLLIGHPVSQSLSPLMHNAALAAAGMSVRYEALDVTPDDLESVLAALARENCAGNVTVPHKKRAMGYMGSHSEVAHLAGAVNTFWSDGKGGLEGDNTDVSGFDAAVVELLGGMPEGARVAILGAGGAAGAVLTAIDAWPGATASVHSRDLARAAALRMRHSVVVRACSMRDPCIGDADLVVNATPIGMGNNDFPAELERLAPRAAVFDLVYGRGEETAWVRAARERGHTASDGLRMLLHQGVAAFERWFAVPPEEAVMWQALLEATGRV